MADGLVDWDGEFLVQRRDAKTGALLCIALHRRRPFPSGGGTRIRAYPDEAGVLDDACSLSQAMSYKLVLLDLPRGGGKGVIGLPAAFDPALRRGLLERYGDFVESLGGAFGTGPDLGSSPEDMDIISGRTRYVFGRTGALGGAGSSGPMTAAGVFEGIVACLAHVHGSADLPSRRIAVQGAGSVGAPLAVLLVRAGARVVVADPHPDARSRLVTDLPPDLRASVTWGDPASVMSTECDVFAPCATGGVLNEESIPRLNCSIVAGGANNPLSADADAGRLQARGILYAPDFVINGGGSIHLLGREQLGWSEEQVRGAIGRIGEILSGILKAAAREEVTPLAAALTLARARLEERTRSGIPAPG